MKAIDTVDTTVIDLRSHPAWRSSRQHSSDLREAMRRHPSYQRSSERRPIDENVELPAREDCVVTSLTSR